MANETKETTYNQMSGEKVGHFSTSEQKWINKITKWTQEFPESVKIKYKNTDGSLYAEIPSNWFTVRPKRKRNLTEEQRQELKERGKRLAEIKKSKS